MSTEVGVALIAAFAPIMAALGVLIAKIGGVPKKLEEVHKLVNDRYDQVLKKLEAAEVRIVEQKTSADGQILALQRLVTLMTAPPSAAEVLTSPAMVVIPADQSSNRKTLT